MLNFYCILINKRWKLLKEDDQFAKQVNFGLIVSGFTFNTMILNSMDEQRNSKYSSEFYQPNFRIKKIPRIENHNELLIIEKIK